MNTALPFQLNDRVKLPTHHEECDNQHVSGQIGRVITCMKRRGIVWCKVEVTSTVGTFLEVELPASLLTLAESAAAPTTPAAGATPAEPTTMGAQPTQAQETEQYSEYDTYDIPDNLGVSAYDPSLQDRWREGLAFYTQTSLSVSAKRELLALNGYKSQVHGKNNRKNISLSGNILYGYATGGVPPCPKCNSETRRLCLRKVNGVVDVNDVVFKCFGVNDANGRLVTRCNFTEKVDLARRTRWYKTRQEFDDEKKRKEEERESEKKREIQAAIESMPSETRVQLENFIKENLANNDANFIQAVNIIYEFVKSVEKCCPVNDPNLVRARIGYVLNDDTKKNLQGILEINEVLKDLLSKWWKEDAGESVFERCTCPDNQSIVKFLRELVAKGETDKVPQAKLVSAKITLNLIQNITVSLKDLTTMSALKRVKGIGTETARRILQFYERGTMVFWQQQSNTSAENTAAATGLQWGRRRNRTRRMRGGEEEAVNNQPPTTTTTTTTTTTN